MPYVDGKPYHSVRTCMTFATDVTFGNATLDAGMEIVGTGSDAYLALKEDPTDTFAASGEWVSDIIDSDIDALDWMTAYAVVDYPQATTTLTVEIKVASDTAHFPLIGWSDALTNGAMMNHTGRYIQGRITMTGDGLTTPKVHELQCRYDGNPMTAVEPKVAA